MLPLAIPEMRVNSSAKCKGTTVPYRLCCKTILLSPRLQFCPLNYNSTASAIHQMCLTSIQLTFPSKANSMHCSYSRVLIVCSAFHCLPPPPCRVEALPSVSLDGFLQVAPQIVTWQGISCKVTQGHSGQQRQILHSISGVAAVRGEDGDLAPCLFAVLGPSGAGKTTFMDILSGRKRDSGRLHIWLKYPYLRSLPSRITKPIDLLP